MGDGKNGIAWEANRPTRYASNTIHTARLRRARSPGPYWYRTQSRMGREGEREAYGRPFRHTSMVTLNVQARMNVAPMLIRGPAPNVRVASMLPFPLSHRACVLLESAGAQHVTARFASSLHGRHIRAYACLPRQSRGGHPLMGPVHRPQGCPNSRRAGAEMA